MLYIFYFLIQILFIKTLLNCQKHHYIWNCSRVGKNWNVLNLNTSESKIVTFIASNVPQVRAQGRLFCHVCHIYWTRYGSKFSPHLRTTKYLDLGEPPPPRESKRHFLFHMLTENLFGTVFVAVASLPQKVLFEFHVNGVVETALERGERNLRFGLSSVTNQLCDLGQVIRHLWVSLSSSAQRTGLQKLCSSVPNPALVRVLWNEHTKQGASFTWISEVEHYHSFPS